ncbi:hypothetical protein B0T21DRAFT_78745 [Apiosordaria backusii]|uniref:Rhodopsin domain-containing protein n=1 Tax=Apiosordaria backusii TaxID=314023 RepID=A0AA40A746_9PEZI|nr:hypothetical protein B0T21DRAFT_78745 [Apiosordaria backusii]
MAGPSPNPALDEESRVPEIIAILSVASILSTLVVSLRCYSRAVILRTFGLDDAVIIPAQILTLATAVAIGLEAKYGLGRHSWTMPAENYIPYMKSFYSSIVVYNVGVGLAKISILLQYKRIFSHTILRQIIKFGLGFLICWTITLCFLLPLACVPVAAFWDPDVEGFCLDNATIWYIMAGVNVVTDFTIFSMPIPVIKSLQLPKLQRAMLFIVFTLGVFPCAVSIYRIRTLSAAAQSTDPTWDNVSAATFSFLELSVGVIAICLPTLRPALKHAMPSIFGSLLRSSGARASRMPPYFGAGAGTGGGGGESSARRGSMFKRTLRESDSTQGLRDLAGQQPPTTTTTTTTTTPRSRMEYEYDLESGELDPTAHHVRGISRGCPGAYSVSVVAGGSRGQEQPPESRGRIGDFGEKSKSGVVHTTTVVTQQVSAPFAALEEVDDRVKAREREGV